MWNRFLEYMENNFIDDFIGYVFSFSLIFCAFYFVVYVGYNVYLILCAIFGD